MNRASSATGWVRNPIMKSPNLDPTQASNYELGWTLNPITGCLNNDNGLCKGGGFPCYAYKLAHTRLKQRYLANKNYITWRNTSIDFYDDKDKGGQFYKAEIDAPIDPFYPRFWEERVVPLHIPRKADSPKKGIFVCDMGELFGNWIPKSWQEQVFNAIKANPDYRFYLLTKQPQNLIKFSPFPDNCWVGVTATRRSDLKAASYHLKNIEAQIKYLSLEPLLEEPPTATLYSLLEKHIINWLIIGACTGTADDVAQLCSKYPGLGWHRLNSTKYVALPKIEWVREIVEAADKAGVKVFLKDNLRITATSDGRWQGFWRQEQRGWKLRQELPEIK